MIDLRVIGGRGSHDALRRALEKRNPCKALDAPAGEGALTQRLLDLNWEMSCADIDGGNFKLEGVPFKEADLNRRLPFDDAEFDAVICANGLHRLYSPDTALREFCRVLKPGGTLYVNVNNYSSIDRRLRFLFTGSISNALNEVQCQQTIDNPEAHVRIGLTLPRICFLLEQTGFRLVRVAPTAVRTNHRLLAPLAWLIRLLAFLTTPPRRQRRYKLKWVNGFGAFPGGRYILIEAVKDNNATGSDPTP